MSKRNLNNMQGVFDQIHSPKAKPKEKIVSMDNEEKITRNFILRAGTIKSLYELKYNYFPKVSLSEIVEMAIECKLQEVKKK